MPEQVREEMTFELADDVAQVLAIALGEPREGLTEPGAA